MDGDVVTRAAPAQAVAGIDVRSEQQRARVRPSSALDRVGELRLRPAVVDGHPRAGVGEEPGEGDPAPGEAEDA